MAAEGYCFGTENKCPICGKLFWVKYPKLWRYRTNRKDAVCSWTCLTKYRAEQEKKHPKKTAVIPPETPRKKPQKKQYYRPTEWYWLGGLDAVMREKDLTDREIAEKIRKTPSMIYHYRLLKSKCPQKTVNAIAGVLGVSAEIIATKHAHGRGDKPPNAQGKEVWYWLGGLDSVMGTKGETDRSVASAVGRSATTIYCYRTLRAKCKECIAIKIADALGVSSEEIISECADGNKSSPRPENVVWCLLGGLDAMMTQRGIGTTELGRMVGRRPCTIHQYRNLNSKCQEKTAIRIAAALGVSPEEIITAKTSCRFAKPKPDAENKYNRDRNEWCLLGGLENVIEKKKAVVSELCRTTGIDRRSIQRYKALRTKCHTGTAAKIAAALGVSDDEIITKYVDGKYTPWRKITKGGNV